MNFDIIYLNFNSSNWISEVICGIPSRSKMWSVKSMGVATETSHFIFSKMTSSQFWKIKRIIFSRNLKYNKKDKIIIISSSTHCFTNSWCTHWRKYGIVIFLFVWLIDWFLDPSYSKLRIYCLYVIRKFLDSLNYLVNTEQITFFNDNPYKNKRYHLTKY